MYLNFNIIKNNNLLLGDVELLTAVKLKEEEYLSKNLSLLDLNRLVLQEYVEYAKSRKKSATFSEGLKLTEKGKQLLIDISFEGAVDSESDILANWVITTYKNKTGGIVKNKREVARRLHWFKTLTQIKGNFLALLIQAAISDSYNQDCGMSFYDYKKENPRAILSNMAENLFWTPASIFDKNKTLCQSPLYSYYEDNSEYIKQLWKTNLDENGNKKN